MMRLLLLAGTIALLSSSHAQTRSASAAPSREVTAPGTHERSDSGGVPLQPVPPLEQRVADLEAYINNSPRGSDAKLATTSNIAGPGPSYNAWIMTCAALVLFMTLPRLALFYGGLVRAKNVL